MAGEVARPGTFWIGEHDISQIPLVGEMTVPHRYADGQDLSDRLGVNHEMIRVRVGGGVRGA